MPADCTMTRIEDEKNGDKNSSSSSSSSPTSPPPPPPPLPGPQRQTSLLPELNLIMVLCATTSSSSFEESCDDLEEGVMSKNSAIAHDCKDDQTSFHRSRLQHGRRRETNEFKSKSEKRPRFHQTKIKDVRHSRRM